MTSKGPFQTKVFYDFSAEGTRRFSVCLWRQLEIWSPRLNFDTEGSRWSVDLELMKVFWSREQQRSWWHLDEPDYSWISYQKVALGLCRMVWSPLGHHCFPPWSKTVAIHVLKLIPVARVSSKADFMLLFSGWKGFAVDMNSHVLS